MVEGVRQAREALGSGVRIRLTVASPRLLETPGGTELLASLSGPPTQVAEVSDRELARLSDTKAPQGILLVCERNVTTWAELSEARRLVALDGVQDPGNVGTLVRSAHAFGLDAVVALEGTADPWSPKAARSSAGSVFHIPVVLSPAVDLIDWASNRGIGLKVADAGGAAADAVADPATTSTSPPSGLATSSERVWVLVIGNEGWGVSDRIRDAATEAVSIATTGGAESLNAGVAGSILMYEFMKTALDD